MSLEAIQVNLVRDAVVHLQDISTVFERGRLTTVIGRTLAGKTSLLRSIAGLVEGGVHGRYVLDGRDFSALPPWKRNVAMVYQQFINYPHLDVFDNIAFPLRRRRRPETEVRQQVERVLERVGLSGFEHRKPAQLSGGQQQRVALARALCREAGILLLDEPLVNLDYKLREQLREEFRELLVARADAIMIYTTTEPAEALQLGDQVVVMHEGRILQTGTPAEVYERPASDAVAGIINDPPINLLPGSLDGMRITLDGGVTLAAGPHMAGLSGGRYRFGLRASDVTAGSGALPGRVTFMEVSGSETTLYLETACGALTAQLDGVHVQPLGARVMLDLPGACLFAFDVQTGGLLVAPPAGRS